MMGHARLLVSLLQQKKKKISSDWSSNRHVSAAMDGREALGANVIISQMLKRGRGDGNGTGTDL